MLKKINLILIASIISFSAIAQSADSVYDKYVDFNLAKFQGDQDKVIELGEDLIPLSDKLPEKTRINFYFSVGNMYENADRPVKAILYYEKVAAAVPDYYVVHRALGYLYLNKVKAIEKQLASPQYDDKTKEQLTAAYHDAIKKALPHLEKAQACDPNDDTLEVIKSLYKKNNDVTGLAILDKRLIELAKNCIDILSDQ